MIDQEEELREVKEAARLLCMGLMEGSVKDAAKEAVRHLREAIAHRSEHVPLWLSTCADLSAAEASPIVVELLTREERSDWQLAAIDAVRGVLTPDDERATKVAERLHTLAEELRDSSPNIASRALLGAIMLDGRAGVQWLRSGMETWPPELLEPSFRAACGYVSTVDPTADSRDESLEELREAVFRFVERAPSAEGRFTKAMALELLAILCSSNTLDRVVQALCDAYSDSDVVVRAGAASGTKVLLERQVSAAITFTNIGGIGTRLLEASETARRSAYYGKFAA